MRKYGKIKEKHKRVLNLLVEGINKPSLTTIIEKEFFINKIFLVNEKNLNFIKALWNNGDI